MTGLYGFVCVMVCDGVRVYVCVSREGDVPAVWDTVW